MHFLWDKTHLPLSDWLSTYCDFRSLLGRNMLMLNDSRAQLGSPEYRNSDYNET